jgi:hypothetical protein
MEIEALSTTAKTIVSVIIIVVVVAVPSLVVNTRSVIVRGFSLSKW